jgi:O-antigen/teichoic acid export membrane protein
LCHPNKRLEVLAQIQIQGIGNATEAALADLYAQGETERFNARLIELTRLVALMGVTFMVAVASYNHHFIKLWVGEDSFGVDGSPVACNGFLQGLLSLGWCFGGTGKQPKLVRPAKELIFIHPNLHLLFWY